MADQAAHARTISEAEAESDAEAELIMPPVSLTREPFINEPPQDTDEPKRSPLRRFAPIASIEPEPEVEHGEPEIEPEPEITSGEVKSDEGDQEESKNKEAEPVATTTKVVEPVHQGALDDDDLDVPAFIRRKVE